MADGNDRTTAILRKFTLWGVLSLVAYLIFITEVQTLPGSLGEAIEGAAIPIMITAAIGFILFAPAKWATPVKSFFGLAILAVVLYWVLF